jgi:phosphatidylglycerol:prolipoprotein diacylglycerol transferase
MVTISIDPILVYLGPVAVSWYGLAVAAAIFVGFRVAVSEARRRGIDTNPLGDLLIWVVIGGLLGGRLLHVVDQWSSYAADPMLILMVQNGGLAIEGAILGGTLAGIVGARRLGLPIRRLSDAVAPGIVLGQAVGRLGCLVTGDALGPATNGAWGIRYVNPGAMAPQLGTAYQPTFLYEAIWDLVVFAILWSLRGKLHKDGQLFAVYLGLYAAGKFALTFLRNEAIWLYGLQEAQLVAIGVLLLAISWWRSAAFVPAPVKHVRRSAQA